MVIILMEISKYIILFSIVIYTFLSFYVFRVSKEENRYVIYKSLTFFIFFIQFFGFLTLFLKTGKLEYFFFYCFVQVFLFCLLTLTKFIYSNINILLLKHIAMLMGIGFLILCRLNLYKSLKQFFIAVLSYAFSLCIPFLLKKFCFYKKISFIYGLLGTFLLGIVFLLGNTSYGAKLSFSLLGIVLQPSEFVKIIFLFFLASSLYKKKDFKQILYTSFFAGLQIFILVLSKDLGSALLFFLVYIFVLFFATQKFFYLWSGFFGGGICAFIAYSLFDHVKVRVNAWRDPFLYIDTQGYQMTQSLFSIGGGGWFGLGLFEGMPKKIPFVEMDFIFSAICEELGVLFGICLIFICLSCFIIMMNLALRIDNHFYQLLSAATGILYISQVFLTIGGGIKFIPLTGVTLPFISSGGSSVMVSMFLFFLIEGIYVIRKGEEKT